MALRIGASLRAPHAADVEPTLALRHRARTAACSTGGTRRHRAIFRPRPLLAGRDAAKRRNDHGGDPAATDGFSFAARPCARPGCTHIGKTRRCVGCKAVHYCSIECQSEHWADHQAQCHELREAAAGSGGDDSAGEEECDTADGCCPPVGAWVRAVGLLRATEINGLVGRVDRELEGGRAEVEFPAPLGRKILCVSNLLRVAGPDATTGPPVIAIVVACVETEADTAALRRCLASVAAQHTPPALLLVAWR
eukprot:gene30015-60098_t